MRSEAAVVETEKEDKGEDQDQDPDHPEIKIKAENQDLEIVGEEAEAVVEDEGGDQAADIEAEAGGVLGADGMRG